MNKWLNILIGLVVLSATVYLAGMNYWNIGADALALLKGGLTWMIGFIGLVLIILGINDLKE